MTDLAIETAIFMGKATKFTGKTAKFISKNRNLNVKYTNLLKNLKNRLSKSNMFKHSLFQGNNPLLEPLECETWWGYNPVFDGERKL